MVSKMVQSHRPAGYAIGQTSTGRVWKLVNQIHGCKFKLDFPTGWKQLSLVQLSPHCEMLGLWHEFVKSVHAIIVSHLDGHVAVDDLST